MHCHVSTGFFNSASDPKLTGDFMGGTLLVTRFGLTVPRGNLEVLITERVLAVGGTTESDLGRDVVGNGMLGRFTSSTVPSSTSIPRPFVVESLVCDLTKGDL